MIRVILTDDHEIFREALWHLLSDSKGITVVAQAGNINELLAKLSETECDVLVLDIELPGKRGLEALKEIRAKRPRLPILILSMHPEEHYALRAVRAGAAGYLTKHAAAADLVHAIKTVHAGRKFVSTNLAELLFNELNDPKLAEPHTQLSDREFRILCLIGSGVPIADIASELCLNSATISSYRRRILLKMFLKGPSELAEYVVEKGLTLDMYPPARLRSISAAWGN